MASTQNPTPTGSVMDSDLTRSQRMKMRFGDRPAKLVALICGIALTVAALLLSYLLILWVATQLTPMLGVLAMSQLDVRVDQLTPQTAVLYWVAPLAVLVGIVVWLSTKALRGLWRARTALASTAHRLATGEPKPHSWLDGRAPGHSLVQTSQEPMGVAEAIARPTTANRKAPAMKLSKKQRMRRGGSSAAQPVSSVEDTITLDNEEKH